MLAQLPAFPGAEGYGALSHGGRGGDVYIVTNLNASGAGSFAEAIATVPPVGRTIVFAVSGYIRLPSGSNGTRLTASKVTIAGQTAPGDGIGFTNNFLRISGDDVVLRHLRFRRGKTDASGDCIDLDSGCYNAVLDHLSIQFSTDENISSFSSPPENLTMQWTLNAWGLESHSCGGLWDQNHATCHHTLWSHNHTRNPKARPNGLLEWVNNVTFDWDIGFIMGDSTSNAAWQANVINNYFIGPVGNTRSKALQKAQAGSNGRPNFTVFLSGNLSDYDGDGQLNGTDKGYSIVEGTDYAPGTTGLTTGAAAYYKANAAIAGSFPGVTTDPAALAYKKIVSNAGALRMDVNYPRSIRDEVDTILVNKLTTQARAHVSNPTGTGASNAGFGILESAAAAADTDKDGMPDFYETALGWSVAVQDHNTALPSSAGVLTGTTFFPSGAAAGYTRLEEYLFYKGIPHGVVAKNVSGSPTSLTVNLGKFTSGFSASPVFTASNAVNGSVSVSGSTATFTPTQNYTGRGRFEFTVTDSGGHTWTQTCAIVVINNALPRDLKWAGDGAVNQWDGAPLNWRRNGAAVAWSDGDFATFDDSGSNTPGISFTNGAMSGGIVVDSTKNYTFSGSGDFLIGPLTKRGTGTLSLTNTGTNQISPIVVENGTLSIGTTLLGSGVAMALEGGTLAFSANPNSLATIAVTGDTTIAPSGTRELVGTWSGTGTGNMVITGGNTLTLPGNLTAFGGRFALGTSSGYMRLNNSASANTGSAAATFDLGTASATLQNRNGNLTIDLGALSGGVGTTLTGASSVANPTTYSIGANGASTTFAGTITNSAGTTAITKVGGGTLTITGTNAFTGATTVNAGSLANNGTLVSATTVASGAILRGAGTFNGAVTTQSGAQISPGPGSGQIGLLTAAGGLSATSTNFSMQLSSSPAGMNDRIAITGGTGMVSGTNNFDIAFAEGALGAGNYKLIECAAGIPLNIGSGMVMNLTTDAPAGARQTFGLNRTASGTVGGYIQLTVTGTPATLTWTGAANNTWDTTTANNWSGATPNTFFPGDAVVFSDSSAVNNVVIPVAVVPRATAFNNITRSYTLNGPDQTTAAITGGSLTKTGSGALILTGKNSPTSTTIGTGATITLANDNANSGGLGTGPITLNGGTISMYDNTNGFSGSTLNLVVPLGQTGTLRADSRHDIYGTLTGGGVLNFRVPWIRTTLYSDWSDFTGTINVTTDGDGGDLRMGTDYSFPGFPLATVNLADRVGMYYTGILSQGAGTTIEVGELSGGPLSGLSGGPTGGRNFTYRIGGKTPAGSEVTFAGSIGEQVSSSTTSIHKTGVGAWRLSGSGSWNGGLIVEEGTLRLWPSTATGFTIGATVDVLPGATLDLGAGRVRAEAINIAAGATLTVQDDFDIEGDLNIDGTASILTGHFTVTGDVVNNGTLRLTGLSTLAASGEFTNNGILDLLTSAATLPANFENNGTVILNSERRILTAVKSGANFTVTVKGYSGHTYQLQRANTLTGSWTSTGTSQSGTGSTLTLTDVGGATGPSRFYRVVVTP